MTLQPIADYTNVEHCLSAVPTFVHPHTGNIYSASIEKNRGSYQDLVIRRMPPVLPARWEEIKRYEGGKDAVAQFGSGGAVISRHGVLVITCTCQPKDHPLYKPDGFPKFQSCWDWQAGVDDPYLVDPAVEELKAEVAALKAQVAALSAGIGTLTEQDRASLNWTAKVRSLE